MNTDIIEVNTQSSIRINSDKIIYFDPFKIEDKKNDADIVFITHSHYDHMDSESINNIIKSNTIVVAPKTVENDIKKIPAYNIGKSFHPKDNNWLGYLVTINNVSYYIAGDTDKTNETEKIKCDIALVPIGGHFTMDVNEAANLIRIINPNVVIPTHYGSIVGNTEDGKRFKDILSDTDIEVIEKLHFEK